METLEQQFKSVVKGDNFMTPDLIGYYPINNGVAELTKGRFMSSIMYGVTVVQDGIKADGLSQCLGSMSEATDYINSLKA